MYIQKQEYDSTYIICLTFSCIAYLRNLFDDDCFENIHIDGLNLKKVRNCDDNTLLFLQWIDEGIRDALVNKYLKKIIMLIYESSQKEVIETYTYDITYEGNEGKNNLLKKLCVLTQTLKPLPKMKYIYFKLVYTENTPNDYEPPHFKASRNHKYQFITEPLKLDAGRYSNEWETVELKIETIYDLNKNTEIDTCKNDNTKIENKNINKEEIKCTCSINIEDLDMLQCDRCKNWLHTVCCGFFSNTDKRIPEGFYTCLLCTEKRKQNLIQHKQLSVYRRCLSIIYNENIHSLTWFARRIGISLPYAGIILKRLNDEGFVRKHKNKKEIKYEVVKSEESKERLKKYFCLKIKKETKSSITIKNIRCHSFY